MNSERRRITARELIVLMGTQLSVYILLLVVLYFLHSKLVSIPVVTDAARISAGIIFMLAMGALLGAMGMWIWVSRNKEWHQRVIELREARQTIDQSS